MMDAILDPRVEEVTLMTCARVGKTTVIENIVGYFVDYDPSSMLMILPSDRKAENISKLNIAPMIRDNECLRLKFAEQRSRKSSSKILLKTFAGGALILGGANAPGSLSSLSVRIVAFDETDEYPPSAGIEGDPIDLGRTRAVNYLNRKYIYTSTPTEQGLSRIEELWKESDQRLYYVPCPVCKHMQILVFGPQSQFRNLTSGWLKFDKANLSWVYYECSNCQAKITEHQKPWMLRHGQWRPQRSQVKHHAGFHINRLYSPWSTWNEIAKEFMKSEKRREKLKVWVNKTLGETWVEKESYVFSGDSFLAWREAYECIPRSVVLLTAGVDVQDNRLEVIILGWGKAEECWFIDRTVIHGSPAYASTWKLLYAHLTTPIPYENGYAARFAHLGGILAVGIDTRGHHTKQAYEFVKKHAKERIFGIAGVSGFGKAYVRQSRSKKVRVPLFLVGADAGKQLIYDRLMIEIEKDKPTPGGMHFNMKCDKEFFDQLTSNKTKIVRKSGVPTKTWILPEGSADEVLDCYNYNLAAYTLLNPKMEKLAPMIEARLKSWDEARDKKQTAAQPSAEPAPKVQTGSRKKRTTISLKKFLGNY